MSSLEAAGELRPASGGGLIDSPRQPDPAPTAPAPEPGDELTAVLPRAVTARIVRFRWLAFLFVAIWFVAAFNGQWRVGRDTALYRGLAVNLAEGRGYTFGGSFAAKTVYPGYPLLLAAVHKVFGPADLPPLLMMYGISAATLVMTYRLVRLRYPQWMAVLVVLLLGCNAWYLELSNELLTDVPFLLGVVLALYGWERWRLRVERARATAPAAEGDARRADRPSGRRETLVAWAYLVAGLVVAVSIRPTFWILAGAWVATSAWGLLAHGNRRLYAGCLLAVVAVGVLFVAIDPRTRGFRPLGGGYESDLVRHGIDRLAESPQVVWTMLEEQFPELFFGAEMPGPLRALSALVLVGTTLVLLKRGHVLWGLMIPCTVAATLLTSVVPRYYLMVHPLMLLGWLLLAVAAARRVPVRWREAVLVGAVALVLVPNLVRCVKVVADQRVENPGGRTKWAAHLRLAEIIAQQVPPGGRVIGPAGSIMTYFSGRPVYMTRELLPSRKGPIHIPRFVASLGIRYAVFPAGAYEKGEKTSSDLLEHGVIVPLERLGTTDGMTLALVRIDVPPAGKHWKDNPKVDASVHAMRNLPTPSEARAIARAKREARAEKVERDVRKLKHAAAAAKRRKAAKARKALRADQQPGGLPAMVQPAAPDPANAKPAPPATQPARPQPPTPSTNPAAPSPAPPATGPVSSAEAPGPFPASRPDAPRPPPRDAEPLRAVGGTFVRAS
jgi:hypothetical protein